MLAHCKRNVPRCGPRACLFGFGPKPGRGKAPVGATWGFRSRLKGEEVELRQDALDLAREVGRDLDEREDQIALISQLYARFALRLYGAQRPATLSITATEGGYSFHPTIAGDKGGGVRSAAFFASISSWLLSRTVTGEVLIF